MPSIERLIEVKDEGVEACYAIVQHADSGLEADLLCESHVSRVFSWLREQVPDEIRAGLGAQLQGRAIAQLTAHSHGNTLRGQLEHCRAAAKRVIELDDARLAAEQAELAADPRPFPPIKSHIAPAARP